MARKRDRFVECERNKAIRRVEGLRAELSESKWTESDKKAIERRIGEYERLIDQTRIFQDGKRVEGRTREMARAAAETMRDLNRETGVRREMRKLEHFEDTKGDMRNAIFQTEMNIASVGGKPTVSIGEKSFQMTDAQVRVFYRAYQNLWNTGNVPVSQRNERILEKGGFASLEEAFAVAMGTGDNAQRASIIEKLQQQAKGIEVEFTDEEATTLYNMLGEAQKRKSSPEPNTVASNTEQVATRQVGGETEIALTNEQKLQAIQNFLGDDFNEEDWSYLYE